MTLATTRVARTASPLASTTPAARPPSTITERTGGVGAQRHAARGALPRHRLRDRPHAAAGVSPLAALAVHLAENVMQQHVRRARRVRAREIADDRIEAERRLDRPGLEPAIEHVARALREQIEHVALPGEIERAKALRDLPRIEQRVHASADVRRRREEKIAQHVGDAIEHRVIVGQPLGVAPRIFRDLRLRRVEPAAHLEIPAVRQRQKIRERARDDRKPVLDELASRGSPWD